MKLNLFLSLFSVTAFAFSISSCTGDRYNFNPETNFDGNIAGQHETDTPCGRKLDLYYTVRPDNALAVFEMENKGSCDIQVNITHVSQTTTEKLPRGADEFKLPAGQPPIVNAFPIDAYKQGEKLHFVIACKTATGSTGCKFFYKFSVANKLGKDQALADDSTTLNDSPDETVTTSNGNKCKTAAGDEKVIKTINNFTNTDLELKFEVEHSNTCQCDQVIAYADPSSSPKDQGAISTQTAPTGSGVALIPAKKTKIEIKLKCDGKVKPQPCQGKIKNLKLTPVGNIKK